MCNRCSWFLWAMSSNRLIFADLQISFVHAIISKRFEFGLSIMMNSIISFAIFIILQTVHGGFSYFMLIRQIDAWNFWIHFLFWAILKYTLNCERSNKKKHMTYFLFVIFNRFLIQNHLLASNISHQIKIHIDFVLKKTL